MTTLYSQQRRAIEGTLHRGPLDVSTIIVDISDFGTVAPANLTCRLFRGDVDISSTGLQGTAQTYELTLIAPQVIGIELGKFYNLLYTFDLSGSTITRVVPIFGQYRRIQGEPFYIGQYDNRAVQIDALKWGATADNPPAEAACSLWRKHRNISASHLDSYSAALSGAACTISGTDIFSDGIENLTPGYDYELRMVFEIDRDFHPDNDVCVAVGQIWGDV